MGKGDRDQVREGTAPGRTPRTPATWPALPAAEVLTISEEKEPK